MSVINVLVRVCVCVCVCVSVPLRERVLVFTSVYSRGYIWNVCCTKTARCP